MTTKKIVINVQGGIVQSVWSSDPSVKVEVFDQDDLVDEGKTQKQLDELWKETTQGMTGIY
jgi:hypothetical protein